jgi:pimeloyl-ACP methyl ester carboxylesterase
MSIFFLPGLGLDHRVFNRLDLGDLPVVFIDWIEPLDNERIAGYARRLFAEHQSGHDEITLVGYSFGGIVAQEIAAQFNVQKIILVSSIKSRDELPWKLKITVSLGLHKLISSRLITGTVSLWGGLYDLDNRHFREVFRTMVSDQSNQYLQCALYELATWYTPETPSSTRIYQIHGHRDKTFPIGLISKPEVVIPDGGHFMVYKQADRVGIELRKALGV